MVTAVQEIEFFFQEINFFFQEISNDHFTFNFQNNKIRFFWMTKEYIPYFIITNRYISDNKYNYDD